MNATDRPVLYGLSRSVYTRIARLALEEKGVDYALVEVEIFGPEGVPPKHYARHPFGRIPAFVHGDFSLYETAAITRYVDEEFTGPRLQPSSPRARARMNQVIGVLDAYAYRPMIWDVGVQRISIPREGGTTDEAIVARALPVIETCLQSLEKLLGRRRFLADDELSLADLHAAPMFIYFNLTPEGRSMLARHAALNNWLTRMQTRPSVLAIR